MAHTRGSPESKRIKRQKRDGGGEDRISRLPDDILLCVLEKTKDVRTTVRAGALSRRWRPLPWLLRDANLDVDDFCRSDPAAADAESPEAKHAILEGAMAALTGTLRMFLAAPRSEHAVANLKLRFYLLSSAGADEIGELLRDAVDGGKVTKNVELAVPTEMHGWDCPVEHMLRHARSLERLLLGAGSSSLSRVVTKLSLSNAKFGADEFQRLLAGLEQLRHLSLFYFNATSKQAIRLDLPGSQLQVLELQSCLFERVELLRAPRLERLSWDCFTSLAGAPLSFGSVPRLKELRLVCSMTISQRGCKLSDLLRGTASVESLTLDFRGEKIWILPEAGKELSTSFNKLKKLFIHGIFVEFDLLWTLILLKAAPLVETFGIKVWDRPCEVDDDLRIYAFSKRRHTPWNFELEGSKLRQLKRLEFGGFKPVTSHLAFIKLVMAHASNLETVALEDKEPCKICPYVKAPVFEKYSKFPELYAMCSSVKSTFPKNKVEQDMIVEQLRFEGESLPQIIFR